MTGNIKVIFGEVGIEDGFQFHAKTLYWQEHKLVKSYGMPVATRLVKNCVQNNEEHKMLRKSFILSGNGWQFFLYVMLHPEKPNPGPAFSTSVHQWPHQNALRVDRLVSDLK